MTSFEKSTFCEIITAVLKIQLHSESILFPQFAYAWAKTEKQKLRDYFLEYLIIQLTNPEAIIFYPNGIYHDEQSLKELGNIMSREDGMEIILREVGENRVIQ